MSEPITIHVEVNAEDAHRYPDMKLRLLVRQAVVNATEYDLSVDEALRILRDEADYLEHRIKEGQLRGSN